MIFGVGSCPAQRPCICYVLFSVVRPNWTHDVPYHLPPLLTVIDSRNGHVTKAGPIRRFAETFQP